MPTVANIPIQPRKRKAPAIWVSCCKHSRVREQIKPIVDHIFRIADREKRQFLGARVGHVDRDWKKLLEEKECAEGRARHLAPEHEIGRQSERNEQLQKSSSGHHDPFAEDPEEQMAAFVDRNENQIEPLKQVAAEQRVSDQHERKTPASRKTRRAKPVPSLPRARRETETVR